MILFKILKDLENDEDTHLGRILILLLEFNGKDGTGKIEGLTKLAKLDFLLRYPTCLERALKANGANVKLANVMEHERTSVESKMVRFKYGPWDFRYRRFINILVGMGLVDITLSGRSYHLGITEKGITIANQIIENGSFDDMADRAKVIRRNFNQTGTHLMKFIYKTFPEIGTMQYGDEIKL